MCDGLLRLFILSTDTVQSLLLDIETARSFPVKANQESLQALHVKRKNVQGFTCVSAEQSEYLLPTIDFVYYTSLTA